MNNLVRDARKVREIILMVGDLSDIYVTGFGRMMKDENFSARELDAIASGYTKLLEESNGVLQESEAGNRCQHPLHDGQGPHGRGG